LSSGCVSGTATILLRVVLFGSKARGDFDDESDLDLLIVVRMLDGRYRQYWSEIADICSVH